MHSIQIGRCAATLAIVAAASFWVGPAQAHAKLRSADPAPNATVSAPKRIHLQFSEEITKEFSSFTLAAADGHTVAVTAMDTKDEKALDAMPVDSLNPGTYTVTWTAVASDDGHKTGGTFSFTVR